ncbi:glycoside hydrolase family 2 protein [Halostagnicola bangensis]
MALFVTLETPTLPGQFSDIRFYLVPGKGSVVSSKSRQDRRNPER